MGSVGLGTRSAPAASSGLGFWHLLNHEEFENMTRCLVQYKLIGDCGYGDWIRKAGENGAVS